MGICTSIHISSLEKFSADSMTQGSKIPTYQSLQFVLLFSPGFQVLGFVLVGSFLSCTRGRTQRLDIPRDTTPPLVTTFDDEMF
jgi:hypothetical protein